MAKIYHNKREHLVIIMNVQEATKLNFGIHIVGLNNMILCGTCKNECKPKEIYYVCGINQIMCKDCAEDYCENMNHYLSNESLIYEANHFNKIATDLNMEERAVLTPNGKCVICNKNTINNLEYK